MAKRKYDSTLRAAQVQRTREHLLSTAHALLSQGSADGLTLPELARAAAVSVPTVYRHFPTLDALYSAFLEWIRPRVGQTRERLLHRPAETLQTLPLENFPLFEAHAPVMRALIESRAFNEVRVGSMRDRRRAGAKVLVTRAPGWSPRHLEAAAGAIYALSTPQAWRWLRETWGLQPQDAASASAWAIGALVEALSRSRGFAGATPRGRARAALGRSQGARGARRDGVGPAPPPVARWVVEGAAARIQGRGRAANVKRAGRNRR